MKEQPERVQFGEEEAAVLSILSDAAEANQSQLSVEEIARLMSSGASADEVEMALQSSFAIRQRFELNSGLLTVRGSPPERSADLATLETSRRRIRAIGYLRLADELADGWCRFGAKMASVSGSVSYLSAKEGDDIDMFCIAGRDMLWPFLFRATLLKLARRLICRSMPELCFSCLMDERYALRAFSTPEDPLFARDALTAVVLRGSPYYLSLMARAGWMASYFPLLYQSRLGSSTPPAAPPRPHGGASARVVNMLFYATIGSVVRLKAHLLNRRFLAEGRPSRVFVARIGPDHLLYESRRYSGLRAIYSRLERDAKGVAWEK